MDIEHHEIIVNKRIEYTQAEIETWWLVAQLRRISAPFEQAEMANLALRRTLSNLN